MGYKREEKSDIDFLTNYLPFPQLSPNIMNDADMLRIHDASGLALNVNKAFERYIYNDPTCQVEADCSLDIWSMSILSKSPLTWASR